jgi:REP element-mobilizing transposase RayT
MYERTFFITAVCYGRKPLFRSQALAELFLDTMFAYRAKGKFLLHEFVIMPDHTHFILTSDTTIPMERAVQLIKGGFSYRCNKEANFPGEIWQPRPNDHRIRDDADYESSRVHPYESGASGPSSEGSGISVFQRELPLQDGCSFLPALKRTLRYFRTRP